MGVRQGLNVPKASKLKPSFNAGELSELVSARTDFQKRDSGVSLLNNYVCLKQGPAMRRPGTHYVNNVKTDSKKTRVVEFEFSTTQAYIIEFGDQYLRFYRDQGQIVSGGSPYEISTSYLESELFDLRFTQSADVLYITHPNHTPKTLTRTDHTAWTLTDIVFENGPYLPLNSASTTLVASAATGSVTVTASATTGINDNQGFLSTDVGRVMRIDTSGTWAWGEITGYTDTTNVTVLVKDGNFPTTATDIWRLGVWSDTDGWPSTLAFYEDRLWFGGALKYPQRVDGSRTGDYTNHSPSDPDGTVVDDHAVSVNMNSNKVNRAYWMIDQDKGLVIGTAGGEWIVRASDRNEALAPTNAKADRLTPYGSANVSPVRAGDAVLFVQRSKRKLREMSYYIDADKYRSPDVTKISEHITLSGLKELAYQQEPHGVVWAAREDGLLVGFTYDPDEDVLGWHRHKIGGVSDASGTHAKVESVAVIPSTDGTYDELWLVVQRYINGSVVRHVEYMDIYWDESRDQTDAFFVDAGATYDGAPVTLLSGLDYLEGETVDILADGAVLPSQAVSSGQIALTVSSSKVHIGLNYKSQLGTLSIEAGSADGTPVGMTKRVHGVVVKLLKTLGLRFGPDLSLLDEHVFRTSNDAMSVAPPLYTGDIDLDWSDEYTSEAKIFLEQSTPLPGTILAIVASLREYES